MTMAKSDPSTFGLWALILVGVPLLGSGSTLAGEVSGASGALGLGTTVNGVVGGSCGAGLCQVSGGTAAGSNLFHRFSAFDTRGAITGVNVNTGGIPNVFMAVLHPAGTFIDKSLHFSGPTNLLWLSPGGISVSGAGGFANVQQLNLSTATGWKVGGGMFDAAGTTAGQAALLTGTPVQGLAGAVNHPAALTALGLQKNGDLTLVGGLLTVDKELLLDAQGGNVLLQAVGMESRAGSVAIQGQSVLQAAPVAGASVAISAAGTVLNSALIRASAGAGSITVQAGEAVVQTSSAVLDVSSAGAGGPGGTISVQAGERLFSSATMRANGEGASGSGGTIEVTAPKVTLAAAQLQASGAAGGGAVRVGGGYQGRPLSLGGSNATSTSVNGSSTLKADATGRGDGGQVVVWAEGSTTYLGNASARGGAGGGNGGAIEVSGKEQLVYGGQADARAPQGTAGSLLLDPKNIRIDAAANTAGQLVYDVIPLESPFGGEGNGFAKDVVVLTGGNIVATDPDSDGFGANSGGVYLFDGNTGGLVSALTGNQAGDRVGSNGVTALTNGNYLVSSVNWNQNRGAVTLGSGSSGVSGEVSSANSLVGSNPYDYVGNNGITALSNGNYVIRSVNWNQNRGAVTWGSGSSGVSGEVSSANSLVGSTSGDRVGSYGITALSNGNYVISSSDWNQYRGAVTWGSGSSGVSGEVSSANSLVGSNPYDYVGYGGITALSNGNYVVRSLDWNQDRGAVTWGSGSSGVSGEVSSANSLVGSNLYDYVGGGGITALSNGHYVISSSGWNGNRGAVTWGSGSSGVSGEVSSANSLVGSGPYVYYGFISDGDGWVSGVTKLAGDRFLINSPSEQNGAGKLEIVSASPSAFSGTLAFSTSPATGLLITPAQIAAFASAGTDVILQANNDITLAAESPISFSTEAATPGSLTLQAGRSIFLNSSINTANGNLSLSANDPAALADFREEGNGGVQMLMGSAINVGTGAVTIQAFAGDGGAPGLIDLQSITAGSIEISGDGGIRLNPGATLNTTTGRIALTAADGGVEIQQATISSSSGPIELSGIRSALLPGSGLKINKSIISSGSGAIDLRGKGGGVASITEGIDIFGGSLVFTDDGNISLFGIGGDSAQAADFATADGIDLDASEVSSGRGKIILEGQGGSAIAEGADGFVEASGIEISGGILRSTNGSIALNGLGGTGNGSANADAKGIAIFGSSTISTETGGISLIGRGGESAESLNEAYAKGIQLSDSEVSSITGSLVLDGAGGNAFSTAASGEAQAVGIENFQGVVSTATGAIEFDGRGGEASAAGVDAYADADGIQLIETSLFSEVDINLDGRGGTAQSGRSATAEGVYVEDGSVGSNVGQIVLNGVGGSAVSSGVSGFSKASGIEFAGGVVTNALGALDVSGTGGVASAARAEAVGVQLFFPVTSLSIGGAINLVGGGGFAEASEFASADGISDTGSDIRSVSGSIVLDGTGGSAIANLAGAPGLNLFDTTIISEIADEDQSISLIGEAGFEETGGLSLKSTAVSTSGLRITGELAPDPRIFINASGGSVVFGGEIDISTSVEFPSVSALTLTDAQFSGSGLVTLPTAGITTVWGAVSA
ncbi:MAG: hypothetical protein RLZZ611_658, partial [Cyanobacteriota bacterium]